MISNENDNEVKSHGSSKSKGYRVALTIAGSDSSGGAGIQADIKTFSSLGIYGASAITAVTAQNTEGVHSQFALPAELVYNQIIAVMEDLQPSVVKIGMLSNAEVANCVADLLEHYDIPIVLDPVVVSTSGHRLLSTEALDVVKQRLLPIAEVVTPNIPEMQALTMMPLSTISEKLEAARYLIALGAQAVLLKGGHEKGDMKRDILYQYADGEITLPVGLSVGHRNIYTEEVRKRTAEEAVELAYLELNRRVLSALPDAELISRSYSGAVTEDGSAYRLVCRVNCIRDIAEEKPFNIKPSA